MHVRPAASGRRVHGSVCRRWVDSANSGWRKAVKRLATGRSASPKLIAGQEGCTPPYVIRLIRLAFLAPDIVEKISRGQQPAELTSTKLLAMVPLPDNWAEQRSLLGMAS